MTDTQLSLFASQVATPLGPMTAIADEEALYLLEFTDRRALPGEFKRLQQRTKAIILPVPPEETAKRPSRRIITAIENELALYFQAKLKTFTIPLRIFGSSFQQQVWDELCKIPYGQTCSYLELAKAVGNPAACRAVARANGTNQFAIIIPCHRVINANGNLGGYGGGIHRKQWLLDHELSERSLISRA